MKMCPAPTIAFKKETPCKGQECAWYSQCVSECAIRAIATIPVYKLKEDN